MITIIYSSHYGTTRRLAQSVYDRISGPKDLLELADSEEWGEVATIADRRPGSESYGEAFDLFSALITPTLPDKILVILPTYENFKEQRKDPQAPVKFITDAEETLLENLSGLMNELGVTVMAVAAGNRTFGSAFCAVSKEFWKVQIPVVAEVELSGESRDWKHIVNALEHGDFLKGVTK